MVVICDCPLDVGELWISTDVRFSGLCSVAVAGVRGKSKWRADRSVVRSRQTSDDT